MTSERDQNTTSGQTTVYQIRVSGHLGREWSGWFEGLTVTPQDNGDTLLTGPVADQAALHGLLKQVRDLGLPLLSITHVTTSRSDTVAHWKEARP
jgi:hypothetical protein